MTEQIEDALAALRPETREQMIKELEASYKDTIEDYLLATSDSIKVKLLSEANSVESFLNKTKKVDAEYAEIYRRTIQG